MSDKAASDLRAKGSDPVFSEMTAQYLLDREHTSVSKWREKLEDAVMADNIGLVLDYSLGRLLYVKHQNGLTAFPLTTNHGTCGAR